MKPFPDVVIELTLAARKDRAMRTNRRYRSVPRNRANTARVEKKRNVDSVHVSSFLSGFIKRCGLVRNRPKKTPAKKWFTKKVILVTGIVVAISGIVGFGLYMKGKVILIDFTNWTVKDAKLWALDRYINLRTIEEFNDEVEAGRISKQDKKSGTWIGEGEFISVTVSKGHDLSVRLPLPDFMSMTNDDIDRWIAENYMANVQIVSRFSETVAYGNVINYEIDDPSVIDKVKRDSNIRIYVSKGREDPSTVTIAIPDFKDMTVQECRSFASDNGLLLIISELYDEYAPKGKVMSQSAGEGAAARKGDTVTITVSKGKKVLVPNFTEYTKQAASSYANELKLKILITEKYSSLPAGKLISQSIPAGTEYSEGDSVHLEYSLGNQITVSSFVGQTKDKIETWAKGLNDLGASIKINVKSTKSNTPVDRIIAQDKKNTVIGIKTTITITVSLGKMIYVPDFIAPDGSGYDLAFTYEKAMELCNKLGLIPIFQASKKTEKLPGEIWYQSIAAGKEVSEGTTITLKYNPNTSTLTVPDFTGMTEADIWAADYNMQLDIRFETGDDYVDGFTGMVAEQSLTAWTVVAYGSVITLTVGPNSP